MMLLAECVMFDINMSYDSFIDHFIYEFQLTKYSK